MKVRCIKIKKNELFFYFSFVCLYISLFLGDIYQTDFISNLSKILRLTAYLSIVLHFFFAGLKLELKGFIKFMAIFAVTLAYGLITKDLYWSILIIYIYMSRSICQDRILKISMSLLIGGTICVIFLCAVGVLPDVMTARNSDLADTFVRHSFGFYHSNVLPLIMIYVELYYIFIKNERVKSSVVVMFFLIQCLLYLSNNSRNAFFVSIVFTTLMIYEKYIGIKKSAQKVFYACTKIMVPVLSIFSFAMMFLLLRGGIWNTIDTLFSGRFRLAIFKMRRVGLHFINIMSNDAFVSDNINYVNNKMLDTVTLDNGYLYIILRYGILAILFYYVVSFLLTKKAKGSMYKLTCLLVVFVVNFIDNDLVDYSFLPFIIMAFTDYKLSDTVSKANIV